MKHKAVIKTVMPSKKHDDLLKQFPTLPGVYFFKDPHQKVMYIGKAKSLRTRLRSYFNKHESDWKVKSLLRNYASIDYILTTNELEALLLEATLIRTHKPKYNVLLTSGNPFLYILFTNHPIPEVKLVRTKKGKGTFFGPFLHKREARSVYHYLIRIFRLRICNLRIEGGCLDYHLGLCAGRCTGSFDVNDYLNRIELAKKTLRGTILDRPIGNRTIADGPIDHECTKEAHQFLEERIEYHTKNKEFEKAKNLHEYMNNLDKIVATIKTKFSDRKYQDEMFVATTPTYVNAAAKAGLKDLRKLLKLRSTPRTIDCFDISHFQGRYIVGSCIRFTDALPDKGGFRRFKIKTLSDQNDYAALAEIVSRRYAKSAKEPSLPDVILVDGGKGQYNTIAGLRQSTMVISLAKKEERLFTPHHPEGVCLNIHEPLGQLLIALRDYAHHFAIGYHKLLRKKGVRTP